MVALDTRSRKAAPEIDLSETRGQLARQVLIAVALALAVVTGAVIWHDFETAKSMIVQQTGTRATGIAESIVLDLDLVGASADRSRLSKIVAHHGARPGVSRVTIVDSDNLILADSDPALAGRTLDLTALPFLALALNQARQIGEPRNINRYHATPSRWFVIRPLAGEPLGRTATPEAIIVRLDLSAEQALMARMAYSNTMVTATGMLLVLGFLWLALRRTLLRPLAQLTLAGAESLRTGSFVPPENLPRNELSVLAGTFEHVFTMAARQRADLREANRTLELEAVQRERAEAKAREARDQLIDAIEALPGSFVLFDADRRTVLVNSETIATFPHLTEVLKGESTAEDIWRVQAESGLFAESIGREDAWLAERLAELENFNRDYDVELTDGRVLHYIDRYTRDGGYLRFRFDVTEERRKAAALKASEQRFRRVVVDAPIPIMLHDDQGNVLELSDAWLTYTGYTRQELATTADWARRAYGEDATPETADITWLADVTDVVDQGVRWITTNSGNKRAWHFRASPLGRNTGGRKIIISMAVDISDRLRAEKNAMVTAERFKRAIAAAPLPMIMHADNGEILAASDSFYALSGYDKAELPTIRHWYRLAYGDNAEIAEKRVQAAFEATEPMRFEPIAVNSRQSGKRIWEFSSAPIGPLPDGRRVIVGMAVDLTQRIAMEKALRQSESRLERAIRNAPLPALLYADDGEILMVSNALLDRTGYRPEQLTNMEAWTRLAYRDKAADVRTRIADITRRNLMGVKTDVTVHTADGRVRQWQFHSTAIGRLADGRRALIALAVDMTDRLAAEEALRQSEQRLETAIRHAPVPVIMHTDDGDVLMVSDRLCEVTGYNRDQITTVEAWTKLAYRDASEQVLERIREIYDKGLQEAVTDVDVYTAHGEIRHWQMQASELGKAADGRDAVISMGIDLTERIRAERSLRESEARLNAILEHAPLAVSMKDPDFRYRMVNPVYEQISGLSREEIIGKTAVEAFPPGIGDAIIAHDRQIIETRKPASFTETLRTDGTPVIYHSVKFPLLDDDGNITALCVMGVDISSQVRTERLVKKTQARLESLIDHAPLFVSVKDAEGHYELVNQHFVSLIGRAREDIIGTTAADNYDPETAEAIRKGDEEILESGESRIFEEDVNFNGETRTYLTVKFPLRDDQGEIDALCVMANDITDRKQVEQQVRDRETQLRVLIDTVVDGVIMADDTGIIRVVNKSVTQMFGYRDDELIGANIGILASGADRENHDQYIADYLKSGAAKVIGSSREVWACHKDGHEIPIELAIGEASLKRRRVFVAVLHDITERKEAEARILKHTEDLMRSNAELEQFAYVASHDIQEPLRMVASYCELLERRYKDKLDDDAARYIDYAVDGARRMQALIQDLLAYSRVGTRGGALEPVALDDVIATVCHDLQLSIAEAGATIEAESLPRILGDKGQLFQMFQNLIGNSIKYRSDEAPVITISAKPAPEDPEVMWQIEVRDNGIGIEAHYRDRIFKIFQRLHSRDEYPGTGIGLAVCKRIVERHGGRIWLADHTPPGSVFCMTFQSAEK